MLIIALATADADCYNARMDLHSLILSGSYAAIFLLMLANGIINFPSSQILYLVVGYFVSTGNLVFAGAVLAGSIGNTIGNIITYSLVKKYERPLARKLLMMDEKMFDTVHAAIHDTFSRRGIWWLFLGKLTPSVKAFIPVVAGLARTPTAITSLIFLIASFLWACGIVYLGYAFGEHVSISSFLGVSLVIGLAIVYVIYRNISKRSINT
jgi:membrane protein DedA with SNARE-associated domain